MTWSRFRSPGWALCSLVSMYSLAGPSFSPVSCNVNNNLICADVSSCRCCDMFPIFLVPDTELFPLQLHLRLLQNVSHYDWIAAYQCINSKNNFLRADKSVLIPSLCPDLRQLLRDFRSEMSLIYICGKSPWKRLDHWINYSQSIALWKCGRWWICGLCVAVLWCDHGFVSVIDMNIFQSFKSQTTVQPPSNINSFVSGTMCLLRFSLF